MISLRIPPSNPWLAVGWRKPQDITPDKDKQQLQAQ